MGMVLSRLPALSLGLLMTSALQLFIAKRLKVRARLTSEQSHPWKACRELALFPTLTTPAIAFWGPVFLGSAFLYVYYSKR